MPLLPNTIFSAMFSGVLIPVGKKMKKRFTAPVLRVEASLSTLTLGCAVSGAAADETPCIF